jgi:MFS family permease
MILLVLFPVGIFITRSTPRDMGLLTDGAIPDCVALVDSAPEPTAVGQAIQSANFWLLLVGSTLTIGAIGTVIFHFVLFLRDQGHSAGWASRALSLLLISSLGGRVLVGHLADRFTRKNVMALFYLVLALAIPLLFLSHQSTAVLAFAVVFGFAMGADYMLIPLVAADSFFLSGLGKILALIIMADSLGQTLGPVMAGRIYDRRHSYVIVWLIITAASVISAKLIYSISAGRKDQSTRSPQ